MSSSNLGFYKAIFACFLFGLGAFGIARQLLAETQTYNIDSLHDLSGWSLNLGKEFPGAKGQLKMVNGVPQINYDFSGGGKYVAIRRASALPFGTKQICATVDGTKGGQVFLRLRDNTGRWFQSHGVSVNPPKTVLNVSVQGPWQSAWGGKKNDIPQAPIRALAIGVQSGNPRAGEVRIQGLIAEVDPESVPKPMVTFPKVDLNALGYHIKGAWSCEAASCIYLDIQATPDASSAPEKAVLRLRFPTVQRDFIREFTLNPEKKATMRFGPIDASNPRNVYQLFLTVQSGTSRFERVFKLRGLHSDDVNLGKPRNACDIGDNRMGTMTLFNYSHHPDFAVFADYNRVLDFVSEAGLTWVRDYVRVEPGPDGKLHVLESDMQWIRAAHSKGIHVIATIQALGPCSKTPWTPREYADRCRVAAEETRGLVDVFEMSNEPENFGGFRDDRNIGIRDEKNNRAWNGIEKDGTICKWVKDYLDMANAGAEAIKAVRPKATVIGLGMAQPTNILALQKLDVSKAMNGVAFHPYGYILPPERVPYTTAHKKRDSVVSGDDAGAYEAHVRRQNPKGDRSLWITEFGWSGMSNPAKGGIGYSEKVLASYLLRRFIATYFLPVKSNIHYLFLDTTDREFVTNNNFGLLTHDFRPKLAYSAVQRMTSLISGWELDKQAKVQITESNMPGATHELKRYELQWDGAKIAAEDDIIAYPMFNPDKPDRRQIVLWSGEPTSEPFRPRAATFRITGWKNFSQNAFAVDMISGETYDVPVIKEKNGLLFENIDIPAHPIMIKLFKD